MSGHLLKIKETGANIYLVSAATLSMFGIALLTLYYTSQTTPLIAYYILAAFAVAFILEFAFRLFNNRTIQKQIHDHHSHFDRTR